MPFSTIFQSYSGSKFYLFRKKERLSIENQSWAGNSRTTGLTQPHSWCSCPIPGACSSVNFVAWMPFIVIFVPHFVNRLDRLSCFVNSFTFCILEAFYSFSYDLDSDSLLTAVIEPVEFLILTVFYRMAVLWTIMPHLLIYKPNQYFVSRQRIFCMV